MFKGRYVLTKLNYLQKKSIIEWYKTTKSKLKKRIFIKLYIDYPRSELIDKINIRTKEMLKMEQ